MRLGILFLTATALAPAADSPSPQDTEFFENRIRPVLVRSCIDCHGGKKHKGGLRLDSRAAALRGGDTGPALVPKDPEKSLLLTALKGTDPDRIAPMPHKKPRLADRIIADFDTWIRNGAAWGPDAPADAGEAPASFAEILRKRMAATPLFQPLRDRPVPKVRNASWVRTPIDAFILNKLEAKGLSPAPPADRYAFLRRLTFDLTGLPPTPEDIEAFVNDTSPDAVTKVVDRLLESPHFGEKWARHWLDLVRYGESRGHEFDYTIPNAHHYRDYVIRALNADVPYNQFVLEHIAGDLLPTPRFHPKEKFNESVLGTGWWYLGEWVHSPVDIRGDEMERVANEIEVLGKTFLGLTLGCVRCHDHKFDPLSQADFYALAGFARSSNYRQVRFDTIDHNRRVSRRLRKLHEARAEEILRSIAAARRPAIDRFADRLLAARKAILTGEKPADPTLTALVDHLDAARRDPTDLLHAFALIAGEKHPAPLLGDLARKWSAPHPDPLEGAEVIVDYRDGDPRKLIQDGYSFEAVRAGDIRIGATPERPVERVFRTGAAALKPGWTGLKLAPGTEKNPGKVNWEQAGRMLRTPTFTLKHDNVFYLVRGAGRAFAEVDGHRLVQGPLHGSTHIQWKNKDLHWRGHNLRLYRSPDLSRPLHHLHVQLTGDDPDFEILAVIQGERAPTLPKPRPTPSVVEAVAKARSAEDLAAALQALLAKAGPDAADWMARHENLLGDKDSEARQKAADLARKYSEARESLLREVRRESRTAVAIMDGSPSDEYLMVRGNHRSPAKPVVRRFLEAFEGTDPSTYETSSGRLRLARQMIDPQTTPLLLRVYVNRIWHHLFGRGIVASVDDFGNMGTGASHPDLLDYLAARSLTMETSIKWTIRMIVQSNTYAMSSIPDPKAAAADPTNELFHHMPVRRLQAEAIRDAMLAVSGRLDRKMFGPSIPAHLDGFQDGRGKPRSGPLDGAGRRTIYLSVRRNFLPTMQLSFDFPQPFSTMGRRSVSNVPAQALVLKNNPFVQGQAGEWAKRVVGSKKTVPERLKAMFLSAYGRPATSEEIEGAIAYLKDAARLLGKPANDPAAWQELAHAIFQTREFVFLN